MLFDFHNTLAACDRWLDLEIRTLPALSIERLAAGGLLPGDQADPARAPDLFKALRQQVRESGVELPALDGTLIVLRQMGIALPIPEVEAVVRELEEDCLSDVEVMPGAAHALERLRGAGCQMGVVSSAGYPRFVELALEELGLRPYFSEIITSAGEGIYKSNPEIYRRAVARLCAEPWEAAHVGDHPVFDVQVPREAGLSTIWLTARAEKTAQVRGEPWSEDEIERAGADAVIRDLGELYAALQSIPDNLPAG